MSTSTRDSTKESEFSVAQSASERYSDPVDNSVKSIFGVLYNLSTSDINKLVRNNPEFRDLISVPNFWERKGQHMTGSESIPINPDTKKPFYGVKSWKEYILVTELIIGQVDGLIERLKVIEEPEYQLNAEGKPDQE